jgi:hypothetical protein
MLRRSFGEKALGYDLFCLCKCFLFFFLFYPLHLCQPIFLLLLDLLFNWEFELEFGLKGKGAGIIRKIIKGGFNMNDVPHLF